MEAEELEGVRELEAAVHAPECSRPPPGRRQAEASRRMGTRHRLDAHQPTRES